MNDDILYMTVGELGPLIHKGKISPVDLTEGYLDRLEKFGPRLHAFVTVTRDRALQEAQQAEKEIKAGAYRGPLHGIPYGAKDLFAVKGYPTTWGARPYEHQMIDQDAAVIRKLHDAGAILLGKCAMSEIAGGPPTATATGACRTPWDITRWSGGSSSGSGASVASGLVGFAIGTETWGSIMTPSSFCGVSGFRPTFGRVSRDGAMALCWTMDKVGPLARSAYDCGLILDTISGRDDNDAMTVFDQDKISTAKKKRSLSHLRVGFIKEDYAKYGEPDVASAFEEVITVFRKLGTAPKEITLPDHPYEAAAQTIIAAEEASAFEPLVRAGKVGGIIDPDRRGELLGAQTISAVDYLRCQRLRTEMAKSYQKLYEEVDIILGSSTLKCAPPIDADMNTVFSGGNVSEAAENLLGLPAISVPCGFSSAGLPIGMKIIGRTFDERTVLEAALAYQSVTDWHTKHPRLS